MKQIVALLAFAGGIYSPLLFTSLPSVLELLSFCLVALIVFEAAILVKVKGLVCLSFCNGFCTLLYRTFILCFFAGLIYGTVSAISFQSSVLPNALNNTELILQGRVIGIPQKTSSAWNDEIWKFDFEPYSLELVDQEGSTSQKYHTELQSEDSISVMASLLESYLPQKIRLSYYGSIYNESSLPNRSVLAPILMERQLSLQVKLKRPHGLNNPGLFSYQRWLLGEGYSATGYVKSILSTGTSVVSIGSVSKQSIIELLICWIDQVRANLSEDINRSGVAYSGIQSALLVGDSGGVSNELTSLFIDTGTIHLMVISGLHIGFMAAIGFFLGRWGIAILLYKGGVNALRWSSLMAIAFAFLYAAFAGFSTPTVRALVMVVALMLPRVFLIKTSRWWGLSLALCIVGLIEPRAPLQNGFWLSFGAVTLIFLSMRNTNDFNSKTPTDLYARETLTKKGILSTFLSFLNPLIKIQLVFLIGFAPVILWFQGQLNLVSFIANLVAVPLTSLVIIPLEFIGLLGHHISPNVGFFIWNISGFFIGLEIYFLEFLRDEFSLWIVRSSVSEWSAFISVLGGFGVIGFRAYRLKFLALILMLPLFAPNHLTSSRIFSENNLLEVRVFDVGQGTAVLVRQPGYSLLYDTGPKFSDSFDSGADILAPSLRQLGIVQLDDLVLSHPDSDHIGGFLGLSESVSSERIWLGRKPDQAFILKSEKIRSASECLRGISWRQDEIEYEFLHPSLSEFEIGSSSNMQGENKKEPDNDRSCVLSIRFGGQRVLLAGDISSSVELELLRGIDADISTEVLLAPHHGSKSSSSQMFINHLSPERVAFSAGYLNRFGHPHPDVVKRYDLAGTETYTTYRDGMLEFSWADLGREPVVKIEAEKHLFWWQK